MANAKQIKEMECDLEDAYKAIMATKQGRLIIENIIDECGQSNNSASASNFRTNETFFREGKHWVATTLELRVKQLTPDNYLQMKKEALDRAFNQSQ